VLLAAKIAAGWRAPASGHAHRGGTLGGMPPRVYHPDHTAEIRRRLTLMAVYGLTGLVGAAVAAGLLAVLYSGANDSWEALETAAWIADAVLATLAVLNLLVTLLAWRVYRWRRVDLDAAGAEAVGELHARIANVRRDDPA
jgi:MFS family permease